MIEPGVALSNAVYGTTTGFGLGFAFLFVRWLATFIAGRQDARLAHLDGASRLLVEQLQDQVRALIEYNTTIDAKLAECVERDIEKERRIAQLEGMMAGFGDARQHAQLIVAAEKKGAKGQ